MLELIYTSTFKKSYKLMIKRGYDKTLLENVLKKLIIGEPLSPNNHFHLLKGKYSGMFECHIKPDWLLIFYYKFDNQVLVLVDTGTHSDLF